MDWHLVIYEMKAHTRVCSYDRAGYGWSNPGPAKAPRTAEQIVREMEILLDVAEDYVWEGDEMGREGGRKLLLAGHSMAGFQMRVFQDRNPDLVHAMLFADAVNPDFVDGVGFGNRYGGPWKWKRESPLTHSRSRRAGSPPIRSTS
jgi:pimeloyl-ACP methyl ester carboxylesterase